MEDLTGAAAQLSSPATPPTKNDAGFDKTLATQRVMDLVLFCLNLCSSLIASLLQSFSMACHSF